MAKKKYKVKEAGYNGAEDIEKILNEQEEKGWSLISFTRNYYKQTFIFKKKSK